MTASQCRDAGERSNVDDTAAPGGNHPSPRFLTHTKATIDEVSPGFFDVIQRDFFGFAENSFPRDISEKVALGQAALGGGASGGARGVFSEAQYDQRLFNQDGGGLDAGLGAEDSYNLYDKPLFADRGKSIYRPRRGGGDEGGGEDEGGVGGRAFKPDVGFAGADGGGAAGGSSGPVRFEREQQQQVEQHEGGPSSAAAAVAPADDPFGIDAFVSSVSSKRAAAAAKNKGGSGSMRAAGGGGSAEDYLEGGGGSSRSKVAFERGKGT